MAQEKNNNQKSLTWYRCAAENGSADAQYKLALCYYNGDGVSQDNKEALKWFRKAAEQGHEWAQWRLKHHYNINDYIHNKTNNQKSEECDPLDANAQYELGIHYYNVVKDKKEALKWFIKAAEQGHEWAQWRLKHHYDIEGYIATSNKSLSENNKSTENTSNNIGSFIDKHGREIWDLGKTLWEYYKIFRG